MKIVVIGGHLAPAVALVEGLKEGGAQVLFIGRKRAGGDESLEYRTIRKMGVDFKSIVTGSFMMRVNIWKFFSLVKVPIGFIQSLFWLTSFKPDIVFSFGGYLAIPVVAAGRVLGIDVYIHEQTTKLGLANRLTAGFAKKIFISWEKTREENSRFREKMVTSGNLVRRSIFEKRFRKMPEFAKRRDVKAKRPVIYVTGGNLGAHKINKVVLGVLPQLLKDYIVIHQTGNSSPYYDYDRLVEVGSKLEKNYQGRYYVVDRIDVDEVPWILARADLVIARAGANTISELMCFGVPSILIPLGIAADDEQMVNAKIVEDFGLSVTIKEEHLTGNNLLSTVKRALKKEQIASSVKRAKQYVNKDAVALVLRELDVY